MVGEGDEVNGEKGGDEDATENDDTDDESGFCPGSEGEDEGDRGGGGGNTSHSNRPQPDAGGFDESLVEGFALISELVCEFHDEDSICRGEADKDNQTDLALDIQGVARKIKAEKATADGERDGEEDDKGVDIALKLGGQDQKDHG